MNELRAVTPTQYGAGGLFAAVALACLAQGVTGADLIAYLASSALVTAALVISDALIRGARAGNAEGIAAAKLVTAGIDAPSAGGDFPRPAGVTYADPSGDA